jgi:dTDP-4-dehydrorhamnose reductase
VSILLLGANGQLSRDLLRALTGQKVTALSHSELELCDYAAVRERLNQIKPRHVINTAAFHRVDECEEQVSKAFEVNAYAVRHLAQVCSSIDAILVHVSTDYVFGSSKHSPLSEEARPEPLNVYGVSKLAGEFFVRQSCAKHFIVRSSGLYGVAGASGKGGNFVETMIKLAKENKKIRVVNDQFLSPTYTQDLAEKLCELIQTENYGLYHITNAGQCSWFEFAGKIFSLLRLTPDFAPTTTAAYGAKVQRPAYSVLRNEKLSSLGLKPMRAWPEALQAYLREKKHL